MPVWQPEDFQSRPRGVPEPCTPLSPCCSFIESAKLCGVEPKASLLCATRAALENSRAVTLQHALLTSPLEAARLSAECPIVGLGERRVLTS